MPNAIKWISNVGKSVSYSMIDQLKELNPTLNSFKDDNGDTFKSIKSTLKTKQIKQIAKSINDNEYVKLGREALDNLKSDIRTGKLYNKERQEEYDQRATNKMLGMSDSDFGFDDFNMDDDYDFGDDDYTSDLSSNDDLVDIVGKKATEAISTTVVTSSEYMVQANRKSTKTLFDQNNVLFSKLHVDIGTVNSNIGSLIDFAREATTTHYNNSATFYDNMTNSIQETNSLLKELVDIQKNVYSTEKNYTGTNRGDRYSDFTTGNGSFNISAIFDNAKKNVKDNPVLGLLGMVSDFGIGESLAGSPASFISNAIASMLTPKSLKVAMKDFNETLSGVFGSVMMKLINSNGFGLKDTIAQLFAPDNSLKESFSTSVYKKDAIPFDGVTKKAIVEVIPTYLSKILTAVSDQSETRFDYDRGKFVKLEDIRDDFKNITKENAYYATNDLQYKMRKMASSAKFDKDENGSWITKGQFERDLEAFFEYQYRNAKVFNDRKETIDASTYGMKGGKKSEMSAKLIQQLWKELPNKEKMKLADTILKQRDSQTNNMNYRERNQYDTLFNIFNDSTKAFKNGKQDKGNAYGAASKYQSSIVNILSDIRKEVAYIREYGIIGNGNKEQGENKNPKFDDYDPYNEKVIVEEEDERGSSTYNDDPHPIARKPGESDEDYSRRAAKQAKDRERVERAKKGPMGKFIGFFSDKENNIGDKLDKIYGKPVEFLTKVIEKADETVYDLVFGKETETDERHYGLLRTMQTYIKESFTKFNDWLDENILSPLKSKLTKENMHNAAKRLFNIFGIDLDDTVKKTKEFLFGKKVDGKRTKNGLFGGFIDGVKDSLKDAFGWVKNAFGEAGEWLGLKGKLSKEGKAKKAKHDTASKMYKFFSKKAKEEQSTGGTESSSNTVDGQAAVGLKRVPKTGIYALSEGEAVIPPDYNPDNIKTRYKNEKEAIDKYKKHGGINMLAPGSDASAAERMAEKWKAVKDESKITRGDYEPGEEPLIYKIGDELSNLLGFMKKATGDIKFNAKGEPDDKSIKNEFSNLFNKIVPDIKEFAPTMAAGGIIGGGVSLLTGMIGGPLVGAAVGAGTGLLIKSKAIQKMLFGEWDEENQTYKDGGILDKKFSNGIRKYIPTMAKGATLGGIISKIPGVPGGPIAGMIVGSTIGFISKNEKLYETLFGEGKLLEDLPNKLKSRLPKMGLGAAIGFLGGPFGTATNLVLGATLGYVSDTNRFKELMFGKKDKDGNVIGGIYNTIVKTISKPINAFLKENVNYFRNWFDKTIVRNVEDVFTAIQRTVTNVFDNIGEFFKDKIHDKIIRPIEDKLKGFFNIFGKIFQPLFKGVRGLATGLLGLPFNIAGGVARWSTKRAIRKGKATNQTSAERLLFREDHNMGTGDDFYNMDKRMSEMSVEQLQSVQDSLSVLRGSKKEATNQINDETKKLSKSVYGNDSLNFKTKKTIKKYLDKGKYEEAKAWLNSVNGLDPKAKEDLIKQIDESADKIRRSRKVLKDIESGDARKDADDNLKTLMDLDSKDLKKMGYRKFSRLLDQDIQAKTASGNIESTQKPVERQTADYIINKLDEAVNQLKLLNKNLDPNVEVEGLTPKNIDKKVKKAEKNAAKYNKKQKKKEYNNLLLRKNNYDYDYYYENNEYEEGSSSLIRDVTKFKQEEENNSPIVSFYEGMPMKYYMDNEGDVTPDKGDSETVQAIQQREEDKEERKGILSTLKEVPSKIGEFFGFGKDKDKGEKKDNLFSKILKGVGIAMLAAAIAPTVIDLAKKYLGPILTKIKDTIIDFKNGIVEGFLGKGDNEGSFLNKLGEKLGANTKKVLDWTTGSGDYSGKGLPGIIDKYLPQILKGIEDLAAVALPKLAEIIVSNLPAIIKSAIKGVGYLFEGITHAIFPGSDSSDSETAFKVSPINLPTKNTVGFEPSSSWNLTGIPSGYMEKPEIQGLDADGNEYSPVSTVMDDAETVESKTKGDPRAYTETAKHRLDKVKDQIDPIMDNKNTITTEDGSTLSMSTRDLLDSDKVIGFTDYENLDGTTTKVPVKGYELLNYPSLAQEILHIDTSLTDSEREEAAEAANVDDGNGLFDNTSKNPIARLLHANANSFITGRSNKLLGALGKMKGKKGLLFKLGRGLNNFSTKLGNTMMPEKLIGAERKANGLFNTGITGKISSLAKKFNDKVTNKLVSKFSESLKSDIIDIFKNSKIVTQINKLLGKNVDDAIASVGEELAENCSKKVVDVAAEQGSGAATKIAGITAKKVFIIAQVVVAFTIGVADAPSIAHILPEDCTALIRVAAGIFNVINELAGGFIPADWLFGAVIKALDYISGDDILDLKDKQNKANLELDRASQEAGYTVSLKEYITEEQAQKENAGMKPVKFKKHGFFKSPLQVGIEDYIKNGETGPRIYSLQDGTSMTFTREQLDDYKNQMGLNDASKTDSKSSNQKGGVAGSFYDGGGVPQSGLYALSKGEYVLTDRPPVLGSYAGGTGFFGSLIDKGKSLLSKLPFTNRPENQKSQTSILSNIPSMLGDQTASMYKTSKIEAKALDRQMKYTYDCINTGNVKDYWKTSSEDNKNKSSAVGNENASLFDGLNKTMVLMHKTLLYPLALTKTVYNGAYGALQQAAKGFQQSGNNLLNSMGGSTTTTDGSTTDGTTTDGSTTDSGDTSGGSGGTDKSSTTDVNKGFDYVLHMDGTMTYQNKDGKAIIKYDNPLNAYYKSMASKAFINDIVKGILPAAYKSKITDADVNKYLAGIKGTSYENNKDQLFTNFLYWLSANKGLDTSGANRIAKYKQEILKNYLKSHNKTYTVGSGSGLTIKDYIGSGSINEAIPDTLSDVYTPENTFKGVSKDVQPYRENIVNKIKSRIKPKTISSNNTINMTNTGDNFVSQVDSSYATQRFNTEDDSSKQTVSTAGCAPAAATMVINSIKGQNTIDMKTAVDDALPYKVPNSGVESSYFDDEFNRYGIDTEYIDSDIPNSKELIVQRLKQRIPTILLGKDPSNTSKSNSPFGKNAHYVVADNISPDGKYINIQDPESKTPNIKYLANKILPNVSVGIVPKIAGAFRSAKNKLKSYIGGAAKNPTKAPSGDYIGKNTKRFESGSKGPLSIVHCGNDGGLSYGSYQLIYSGSAKSFWTKNFAAKYGEPTSAEDLKTKWTKAVADMGEAAFFAKEWNYVLEAYYKPAISAIQSKCNNFNPNNYSRALQDCVWAWSVHRGPQTAANEFKQAVSQFGGNLYDVDEAKMINACYNARGNAMVKAGWGTIATGRYGTGADSERAVILGLVGQNPIDYTAPDGSAVGGMSTDPNASSGSSGDQNTATTTTTTVSIIDKLLAPFINLANKWGLSSDTGTTVGAPSGGPGGSQEITVGDISGPVSSDKAIADKQVAVVAKMASVKGKLKYAQNNSKYPGSRNPDDGSGDCSSTVQWAYKKVTGIDVGSWTGSQVSHSNTYTVDESRGKPDESKMQLGDLILYGSSPSNTHHVEMYYGKGQIIGHGSGYGPKIRSINTFSNAVRVRRLKAFQSNGTNTFTPSGSNATVTVPSTDNKTTDTSTTGSGSGLNTNFVSQIDPKYADNKFNIYGDTRTQTIGDTGCAPASATMVLNDTLGNGSGMMDASKLALKYKQPDDGVSADYFGDIYSRNGLSANYYNNSDQVMSDLGKGKDVVLLGSDKHNTSKSNSPFGPNPHYVVASGTDGKNITIKDPEAKKAKQYPINKILGSTKLGIGYGSGLLNNIKSSLKKFVGRGFGAYSGIVYVGDSRFSMMSDVVNEAGVEFIAKSSMGLAWLKSTAGAQAMAKAKADPNLAIIFNMGVNDLYNASNYINYYTQLEKDNPNAKILFMSVNPLTKDPDGYATQSDIDSFNEKMKAHFGTRYLDVASQLKSTGFKCTDGLHYDTATSKKIHEICKSLLGGATPTNTTTNTNTNAPQAGSQPSTSGFVGMISNVANALGKAYGLVTETVTSQAPGGDGNGGPVAPMGPGSTFPTYNMTQDQINETATVITGEVGSNLFKCRQEASQMANLNEVYKHRTNTGANLIDTLNSGWYAKASWTRGRSDNAVQAVNDVLINGHRTLPRYVTEHDTFPLDITNAKSRSQYQVGDPVSNRYGSNYKFYTFYGENKDGDIAGYFQKDYETYKNDIPWDGSTNTAPTTTPTTTSTTGSGSGLMSKLESVGTRSNIIKDLNTKFNNYSNNTVKYKSNIKQDAYTLANKYSGSNNINHKVSGDYTPHIMSEPKAPITTPSYTQPTISAPKAPVSKTKDNTMATLLKTIIQLLSQVVTNTSELSGIVEILSKIVDLQGNMYGSNIESRKRELSSLKSRLANTMKKNNVSNSASYKLSSLMESVEALAAE